jgi:hypothetical protein
MKKTRRIPLRFGNMIGLVSCCFAFGLIYCAPNLSMVSMRFLVYLIAICCLIFGPHCLAHYIVGSLMGVRFKCYLVRRSTIEKLGIPLVSDIASKLPVLSLQIDHASLAVVSEKGKTAMYASGALCSAILPFVVVFSSLNEGSLLSLSLFFCCFGNLLFEFYYSPKAGDFSRIRRSVKR